MRITIVKRLLCLRLPHWPIQRLRAERPELRSGPLLLLRRDSRRGTVVVDCCDHAREAGVRVGTPLAEATGLLPPKTAAHPHDPAADLAALGRLAEHCEQFSPRVGWCTAGSRQPAAGSKSRSFLPAAPEHLFLDTTGVGQLFGGERALTEQVAADCRGLGYAGRVAVAETLGAAWAVSCPVSRVSCPIVIVPPGELLAALRPLPVESLRLPAETVDVLARLGVETIADLLRLPRPGLATRFGPPLLLRLDQALGAAPEMLVPHRPAPRFEAALDLDVPTDRRDEIDWVLDHLIDRVTTALHAQDWGAVRVRGEFRCGADVVRIEVNLYRPTALAKPLRELIRLHCERLVLPGPVDRVRLWADQTIRLRPRQEKLFPDPAAAVSGYVSQLIERLSSRLGPTAVVRPIAQADPLPERAVRYIPLVSRPQDRGQKTEDRGQWRRNCPLSSVLCPLLPDRPLRLFNPPIRIAVDGLGPPTAFHWQHHRHAVGRCWGPERIETGWWRGGIVRRDYYRVETTAGRRLWLFRDLVGGAWFLHGSFE
jgi:protein ImuB